MGGAFRVIAAQLASRLFDFFFFFLASWLLDLKLSPGGGEEEGEEIGEEGEGSTLESSWHDLNEGDGEAGVETLAITEVENN